MFVRELPARPTLEHYRKQARDLLKSALAGDDAAEKRLSSSPRLKREPGSRPLLADAQHVVAREHGFASWPRFAAHLRGLAGGRIARFESAADAVVAGDTEGLAALLADDPDLVRARSGRSHGATLLHYVSANGVEDFRQRTPVNAVEVCRLLLDAGAEVDAPMLDGGGTTLGLVATSAHPALAGVQRALLDTQIEAGASVDGEPGGWNPTSAALHNGRPEAAEHLSHQGATLDLASAAGVGRLDLVRAFVEGEVTLHDAVRAERRGARGPAIDPDELTAALASAAAHGHADVVAYLCGRGVARLPARVGGAPTPLHLAAYGGHLEIVVELLAAGSQVDAVEENFGGSPLGWALYGWVHPPERSTDAYHEVVASLLVAGATVRSEWLDAPPRTEVGERVVDDARMRVLLGTCGQPQE